MLMKFTKGVNFIQILQADFLYLQFGFVIFLAQKLLKKFNVGEIGYRVCVAHST
jgi:hypothetical protein